MSVTSFVGWEREQTENNLFLTNRMDGVELEEHEWADREGFVTKPVVGLTKK